MYSCVYLTLAAFEADHSEKEEEGYRKIHEEYKNMVDFMLGTYMEDIGITPDQFEEACVNAKAKIISEFEKVSLDVFPHIPCSHSTYIRTDSHEPKKGGLDSGRTNDPY